MKMRIILICNSNNEDCNFRQLRIQIEFRLVLFSFSNGNIFPIELVKLSIYYP